MYEAGGLFSVIRILKSKLWTFIAIVATLILLVTGVLFAMRFYVSMDIYDTSATLLEGRYSVDGGEWKEVRRNSAIDERFHTLELRGSFSRKLLNIYDEISLSTKDVWFELKTSDGTSLASYTFEEMKSAYEHMREGTPYALALPETPGYKVTTLTTQFLTATGVTGETELVLTVTCPYSGSRASFADCFQVTTGLESGMYLRFFYEALPVILLLVLVCFFGLFFFPIAGRVLGRTDYTYLSFGALCFFWGFYMIVQNMSGYLNLWIEDPTMCMLLSHVTEYTFVASLIFYTKTRMQRAGFRATVNVIGTAYLILAVILMILQLTGGEDLTATAFLMNIVTGIVLLILVGFLLFELKKNREILYFLLSWIPLILTLGVDILDRIIHLPGSYFFRYGMAVTMVVQIIGLIYDLRQQYLERLKYERLQKELYEAEVAVMVSQIQPHFMYNALTSIAMMCTNDPKKAQEATVTFAKYLRGNMDSLKQKEPVPFRQELEHLKKYLYIEKMRFGKRLNVEYDIGPEDFKLPLLSVQPLVENAVKHGVGMKKKGGTVTIATRETEEAYEVIISDDGVGFDPAAIETERAGQDPGNDLQKEKRSHVGMENTKRRLREMCRGEVVIESKIDEGTVVRIILPKAGQPGAEQEQSNTKD